MKTDPYQEHSKARTALRALIERLTDTVKAMSQASGQARRRLEERRRKRGLHKGGRKKVGPPS